MKVNWIRVLAVLASPFVILWFMVTHPRKVWEQARKPAAPLTCAYPRCLAEGCDKRCASSAAVPGVKGPEHG